MSLVSTKLSLDILQLIARYSQDLTEHEQDNIARSLKVAFPNNENKKIRQLIASMASKSVYCVNGCKRLIHPHDSDASFVRIVKWYYPGRTCTQNVENCVGDVKQGLTCAFCRPDFLKASE